MSLAKNILASDEAMKALGKIYAETMRSQTKTRSGWASGNEAMALEDMTYFLEQNCGVSDSPNTIKKALKSIMDKIQAAAQEFGYDGPVTAPKKPGDDIPDSIKEIAMRAAADEKLMRFLGSGYYWGKHNGNLAWEMSPKNEWGMVGGLMKYPEFRNIIGYRSPKEVKMIIKCLSKEIKQAAKAYGAEVDAKNKEEMTVTESELRKMVAAGVRKLMEAYDPSKREVHPAVYVGTYGKYNNGSLEGEWVNLDDFSSKQEFLRYCTQKLHANERDAELMFQDWEYVPEGFIDESWISERLWELINMDEPWEVKMAVAEGVRDPDQTISVLESGDYRIFYNCDSVEDVVREYMDEGVMPGSPESYFDYASFGHDCAMDGPFNDENESIYEEFGVEEGDDQSLGEMIIDQMYGGIENTPKDTIENYMDVEKIARDLSYESNFVEFDGGMIELF